MLDPEIAGDFLDRELKRIMKGTPIITTDSRVLCYACYQEDDSAELEMWLPDDPENYPEECDNCNLILVRK